MLKQGDQPPDFPLVDQNGEPFHHGRPRSMFAHIKPDTAAATAH